MIGMGLWLLVAAAALLGELLTLSFYLVYEALAAALTAAVASIVPSLTLQLVFFVLVSFVSLFVLRPRTVSYLLRVRPSQTVQYPDLVGRVVVVRERVTDHGGQVDLGGGEYWSARSFPPDAVFEAGSEVEVAYREGLKLVVQARTPREG
jgi:membrane protein implicated in regulation of membrane protease activity